MAEELDDGEFWLPSQFLTDDDILMDFSPQPKSNFSGSSSDLGSLIGSTEIEVSDDDDLNLSRQFTRSSSLLDCAVHSKGWVLSTSPQSTLCGCVCNQEGSSHGSPTWPISPQPNNEQVKEDKATKENNETLDLLCKAAGEVAKMKMKSERSTGTGFFDCSNSAKGLLCPPPQQPQPPLHPQPIHARFPPFYCQPPQFHHFAPQMLWGPVPPFQQHQQKNRVTRNNNNNNNDSNINNMKKNNSSGNPLGLPPSAWPPLQPQTPGQGPAQVEAQAQPQPVPSLFMGQPGPKGTGVFLPRRVNTPAEHPKKKSDGNAMKTKNAKGSQRRNSRPSTTTTTLINDDIKLPPEWTY